MSTLKRTLLHGLLFASLFAFLLTGFGAFGYNGDENHDSKSNGDKERMKPRTEMNEEPHTDKTAARFRFGVYYGRPYYYRPYYYYYPYRPYYYRYNYYPYNYYYRW